MRVTRHVGATLAIFKFLRRVDTGSPTLGKLYSNWFELGESLKGSTSDFKKVAIDKWSERWAYGHRDVAAAAYVVDPEFHSHDQASNEEVTRGYMATVEKIGILMDVRRRQRESPNELEQAWKKRCEFITADKKNWHSYTLYPTYPNKNSAEVKAYCKKVSEQLHHYRQRKGVFACEWVFEAAETMPAASRRLQMMQCLIRTSATLGIRICIAMSSISSELIKHIIYKRALNTQILRAARPKFFTGPY